jgi:hypothetical protein
MLLGSASPDATTLTAAGFAVGPSATIPVASVQPATIRVPGVTLLHTPHATAAAAEAALKSLRGFGTEGRRVAWCNPAELARTPATDVRSWGRRLVEMGGAELVVVFGSGGRDMAVGARDAGLPLGRVVVCRDEATARNVLGDSIAAEDVVLALGVGSDGCQRLADRLESRFARMLQSA